MEMLVCNKSNNSILRDITCPQCGGGSINPHFFGIQTESSNINCNGKLECGIAKLTVCKNKNNKVCINNACLFVECVLQFCLVQMRLMFVVLYIFNPIIENSYQFVKSKCNTGEC